MAILGTFPKHFFVHLGDINMDYKQADSTALYRGGPSGRGQPFVNINLRVVLK